MSAKVRTIVVLGVAGALSAGLGEQAPTSLEQEAEQATRSGWRAARALVSVGGAVEHLGAVKEYLNDIERIRASAASMASMDGARLVLTLRYADAAVRAAIAAAQDERDDMNLFLRHARAIDEQLAALGRPASAPLPIDELEGELWLEVDRYDAAYEAYLRAIANGGRARAWLGLARVNDRLGSTLAACDAYRRASTGALDDEDKTEALKYLNSPACEFQSAGGIRDGPELAEGPSAVCRGPR
jgi:tetratricopeptide (TPR) repeat protein